MDGLYEYEGIIPFLRAARKYLPMQNLTVVILLIAMSCRAEERSVTKIFSRPDQYAARYGCFDKFNISEHYQEYEFAIETNDCLLCRHAQTTCGRERKKICSVNFEPGTEFIKIGMKVCADVSDVGVRICGNRMDFGTYSSIIKCDRRPKKQKICAHTGKSLDLKYEAYNFCAFRGSIRITIEPAFDRLSYACPQETIEKESGTVVSYNYVGLPIPRCPVKIVAAGTVTNVCIKLLYINIAEGWPHLKIETLGVYSDATWRLRSSHSLGWHEWFCDDLATGLLVYLQTAWQTDRRLKHGIIFQYKFDVAPDRSSDGSNGDDDDDDDDGGMSPEYIALTVIGVAFGVLLCYCCVRCCYSGNCCDDDINEDGADGGAHLENSIPDSELERRYINEPVVHNTVRGTLTALNSHSDSPRTSRSGSPHHVPLSLSAIPSPDFREGEEAETFIQPSAPPHDEPSAMSPPSYESLFPNAT